MEIPDFFQQPRSQGQNKIARGHRPAKGRFFFRPFHIFAEPLVVIRCRGIGIDSLLRDEIPVRHADFLADEGGQVLKENLFCGHG